MQEGVDSYFQRKEQTKYIKDEHETFNIVYMKSTKYTEYHAGCHGMENFFPENKLGQVRSTYYHISIGRW